MLCKKLDEFQGYASKEIGKLERDKELLTHERSVCAQNLKSIDTRLGYFKSKLDEINRMLNDKQVNKKSTKTPIKPFSQTRPPNGGESSKKLDLKLPLANKNQAKLGEVKLEQSAQKNSRRSSSATQLERTESDSGYGAPKNRNRVNLSNNLIS
jgi:hypothetical protein